MDKLLSMDEFRAAARADTYKSEGVFRLATGEAKEVDGAERTLRFCFSDSSIDRAGDTINQDGWRLDDYKRNPVALWAHDSSAPPIGRASNVGVIGGRLLGDIEFAPLETYAFADTIYRLAKGGFIKAVSVGFVPKEWSFTNDKDRGFGIDFKEQDLLEISPCPVPCNANALAEARAKGIDTRPIREWAERVLDEGSVLFVPRAILEDIFKATNTPKSVREKYKSMFDTPPPEPDAPLAENKAGRRISRDNMDHLTKALDHIQCIISSNADDEEDEVTEATDPVDQPMNLDASTGDDVAKVARENARATLAATRAAQGRDLTH